LYSKKQENITRNEENIKSNYSGSFKEKPTNPKISIFLYALFHLKQEKKINFTKKTPNILINIWSFLSF
jgi:hypothetical protein